MSVARKDVHDAKVLHDNHRREIDERYIRFVVVLLPQLPGATELLRRNMDEEIVTCVRLGEQRLKVPLGGCGEGGAE